MLFTGMMLAMKLASAPYMRITEDMALPIVLAARDAALENDPLPFKDSDELERRTRTMSLAIVFASYEGAGRTTALGDCSDPSHRTLESCRSIGVMQINKSWLTHEALEHYVMGPEEFMQAPLALQMEMSLNVMRWLAKFCGSTKKGVYAYASGSCAPSMTVRSKIDFRCSLAGGC